MTYTRIIGYQGLLSVSTDGSTYVSMLAIKDGFTRSSTREMAETTIYTDNWKQYLPAQADPGECEFEIGYNPLDVGVTKTLNDGFINGTLLYFKWDTPPDAAQLPGSGAAQETFSGYIKAKDVTANTAELVRSKITIQISGNPGYTS